MTLAQTFSGTGRPTLATFQDIVGDLAPSDSLQAAPPAIDRLAHQLGRPPWALEADVRVLRAAAKQADRAKAAAAAIEAVDGHLKRARGRGLLPAGPTPTGPWAELDTAAHAMGLGALRALLPVLVVLDPAPEDVDGAVLDAAIGRQIAWRFVGAHPDPATAARNQDTYDRRIKQQWNRLAGDLPLQPVPEPSRSAAGPVVAPEMEADIDAYLEAMAQKGALARSTRHQRRDLLRRSADRVRAQGHPAPTCLDELLAPEAVIAALDGAAEAGQPRSAPAADRDAAAATDAELRNVAKALKHVHTHYTAAPEASVKRIDGALSATREVTHTLPAETGDRLRDRQTPDGLADLKKLPLRMARGAGYRTGSVPTARVAMALALMAKLGVAPIELARLRRGDVDLAPIGERSVITLPVRAHARTDGRQNIDVGPRTTLLLHRYHRLAAKLTAPATAPLLTSADPETARNTLLTQFYAIVPQYTDRPLTAQDVRDLLVLFAAGSGRLEAGADAVGASDARSLRRRLGPLIDENAHPRTRQGGDDGSC